VKSEEGHEFDYPFGQQGLELLPRHEEAHDEATPYLRTLYFEIKNNPTVALYNPTKFNRPSPAAKEAIDKIDEINGHLLTFNCAGGLNIAMGQIMRDHFVQLWRLFLYASDERKESHMSALAKMCKDLHYPSGWASIPPGSVEEPHLRSVINERKDR
jgi:hypothetical protein